ncbi:MAG: hypothetical protein ACYTA3_14090 [Planctomycetota bacterium]
MIATRTDVKSACADAISVESTICLELEAGLSALELERRIAQANRAGDIGARAVAYYLVDVADRGAQQVTDFGTGRSAVPAYSTEIGSCPDLAHPPRARARAERRVLR